MKTYVAVLLIIVVGLVIPIFSAQAINQAPVASFTYSPSIPTPQEIITFDASTSYDLDGWIVSYTWDFGDGQVTSMGTPIVTHEYPLDGNYTVELTVVDNDGLTAAASAVIEVSTTIWFRVTIYGTIIPMANAEVTVYYKTWQGSGWTYLKAPASSSNVEIKYDNMTQPDLAKTSSEKYRNPGYTASILRKSASNIGFDIHPSWWSVYFEIKLGPYVAYWPNDTLRVYNYKYPDIVEPHDYHPKHSPYWDPIAGTYAVKVRDIPVAGNNPSETHPIIIGVFYPPPPQEYHLTVDTYPSGITTIPGEGQYVDGTCVPLTAPLYVDISSDARYKFNYWDIDGTPQGIGNNSITVCMDSNHTATANYVTQYQVTFHQTGVDSDFAGTIVDIDATGYTFNTLPVAFWFDSGSSHTFSFYSPLVVNVSTQYDWISTTGLSTVQNGALLVSASGDVTGNYASHGKYQITFDQTGVGSDFTGTVVVVDGLNYGVADLPVAFWFDSGSSHTFSFASPLSVNVDKRYVWTGTSGLSTLQSDSITVSTYGSIIGDYGTQYYLTLVTSPASVASPSGSGWYDANTYATISTTAFVDVVPGSSRYRFNGWTTADMPEITDPMVSPTTVYIDKGKTVTAHYAIQYFVVFDQTGVGSDFTGTVVVVDGLNYGVADLPYSFWWDNDTGHTFTYQSPLVATPNAKQYVWSGTSGLSTLQSDSIIVSGSGSVTGNYQTQYYLTVNSLYDSPTPSSGWFNVGTSITASVTSPATGPAGTRYVSTGWTGTGSVPSSGTSTSVTFSINEPSSITWTWKTQYYLTVKTDPLGLTTILGEDWYDASTGVSLDAPSVSGYDFLNWTVDGASQGDGVTSITVNMNSPHTATAHYLQTTIEPLLVSITPLSTTIQVGQSVTFTSNVSGGTLPYTYQWYLDGTPVSGATSDSWVFTPSASGIYYVHLRVTDANSMTAQSETARVAVVSPPPVGGYSVPMVKRTPISYFAGYFALIALFGAIVSLAKRKRK